MTQPLTFAELLTDATAILREAGIDGARHDGRLLLLAAAKMRSTDLILAEDDQVSPELQARYLSYVARRAAREPVSLILGEVDFLGHHFRTDERALAPRQDSEVLVSRALEWARDRDAGMLVDLGTGSGCLILSFLAEKPGWRGVALDKSGEALSLARENTKALGVSDRVTFIEGGWEAASDALKTADLVISNPPYIRSDVMRTLDPEVLQHDPHLALDGGPDGLVAYRDIVNLLEQTIRRGTKLLFEIGFDQSDALQALLSQKNFTGFAVHKDFSGHNRVVEADYP